MPYKAGFKEALWMLPGVALVLFIAPLTLHYSQGRDASALLVSRAERIDIVTRMRLELASASESEKSAVLATTDEESQRYADQARAGVAEVERTRQEIAKVVGGGDAREREALSQFDQCFEAFTRADRELLELAVKNTNIKAFNLAFGPAAGAVQEMGVALSRFVEKKAGSGDARKLELLACDARTGALQIEVLLAPHIAEQSDRRMDQLEVEMTNADLAVARDLAELKRLGSGPDLDIAVDRYARFSELRGKILSLSRENTNVRSLPISLDQRKTMLRCQDALAALQSAIREAPEKAGAPARPR